MDNRQLSPLACADITADARGYDFIWENWLALSFSQWRSGRRRARLSVVPGPIRVPLEIDTLDKTVASLLGNV
jgi:hypothetical protein